MPFAELIANAARSGDAAMVHRIAHDALAHDHDDVEIRRLAARALMWCGAFAEALPHLAPQDHIFRARAYARLGNFEQSEQEIKTAIVGTFPFIDGDAIRALKEISDLAASLGRPAFKLQPFEKAPALPRSHALLKDGLWDEGVAALKDESFKPAPELPRLRFEALPLWRGQAVGHLIILAHAGYCGTGDVFHFARYVPLIRERCARLSLVVEQPLEAIAKRCLPADDVVRGGREWPMVETADAFSSLMMGVLLADMLGVTYAGPWQITPIEGTESFLPPAEALHVGLCWSASPKASVANNWARRSISFKDLKPLESLPGARFHSVQVGQVANDAEEWVMRHELRTWDNTASLISALDAVVTVDTSIAHLAANVGKPVHLILTDYEDWRWGTGDTTPWYPTILIYRGDPTESVRRIAENLARDARAKWGMKSRARP